MPYAVLFKIYFVDPFVLRQLERLKAIVGDGHVYVVADETGGSLGDIPHDRVIRIDEAGFLERGYAKSDQKESLFWLCTDYPVYRVFDDHPEYDYYVSVEYDAVINADLDAIIGALAAQSTDFVAQPMTVAVADWYWTNTVDQIYSPDDIRPYLESVAILSKRAVVHLRTRRLELSRQFLDGVIGQFPLAEAFLATELTTVGFKIRSLSDFGDTSAYDWWPPFNEADVGRDGPPRFVHPVLDGDRYIDSLLRDDQLNYLFSAHSTTRDALLKLDPRDYLAKLFLKLDQWNTKSAQGIQPEQLQSALFNTPEPSPNIALGKPASQSSVSPQSRNQDPDQDAAGAVNGLVTGSYGFHTGVDEPAWWMVDLQQPYRLDEIWIYNCLDLHSAGQHLNVFLSGNVRLWTQIVLRTPVESFSGAFGSPMILKFPDQMVARFIRLELAERGSLHLDQIKVFGQPADVAAGVPSRQLLSSLPRRHDSAGAGVNESA